MSFIDCIRRQVEQGKDGKGLIPESRARELINMYDELFDKYRASLGDDAAAHAAAEHFVTIQQKVIAKKMENDISAALAQKRVNEEIKQKAAKIQAQKEKGVKGSGFLFGNPVARAVREKLQKVYVRHQSLERQAHALMNESIEALRSKKAGFDQDTATMIEVTRELGGINTGNDVASVYGKSIRETFDVLHSMYEDAGGVLGKLDNYFPQRHTPELVARSSFEEWRDFLKPLLDREKMIDPKTALPMDDDVLNGALKSAYESIRTNGLLDVAQRADAGKQKMPRSGEINMRQASSRFLHFKDVDAFLEYNTAYGVQDDGLFDAVMGHISAMTRDIAIMQEMGPKPNALFRNLELQVQGGKGNPADLASIRGMYDTLAGRNSYHGELPPWYKAVSGWINLKRSAYLGSAPISAISDTFFISAAAKLNGLSASRTMTNYFKALNPADASHRRIARRHLFVANAASGMSLQGARFSDDLGRGGFTGFLAGVTNRASGLAAMTDAGKGAIGMELGGVLAEMRAAGKSFNDIDPTLRQAAELYGIDEKDWDIMLNSKPTFIDEVEADFIFPEDIAKLGQANVETASKFSDWFTDMSLVALNEPTLLTRTITTGAIVGDARPGTLNRLIFSNVFFAKSFPITVMINHLLPSMREAAQGRGGRLAALAVGSAVFGAAALQARQIISGKDPQDASDPGFWVASMLQGGGLGLFGDFIFTDYNRFGTSIGGTLAGPVVGSLEEVHKAFTKDANLGDTNKMLADLWDTASREIPVIRLWYTRLLVERYFLDQVEKAVDPSYDKRMRRIEKRMRDQKGQEFWWTPGKGSPERGPDLKTAVGG